MKKLVSVLLAGLALLPLSTAAAAKEHADLIIRHATIVDVAGARLIADQAVATKGEVIVAVGGDASASIEALEASLIQIHTLSGR